MQYNDNPQQNLPIEGLTGLTSFSKNNDVVIQKSGKGNSAVIIDRLVENQRNVIFLSDQRTSKIVFKNILLF